MYIFFISIIAKILHMIKDWTNHHCDSFGIVTKRTLTNILRRHHRRARACRCVRSLKRPQYQVAERPAALGGKFNFS